MACRMPNIQTSASAKASARRMLVYGQESVRMPNELRTEVEQVKQQEEVKRALKQTSTVKPETTPAAETKDKLLLGTHAIILISLAVVHYVLQFRVFGFAARFIPLIHKLKLNVMAT